ncbi:MAG: helix-turn-helix domain-containing protein, partial [Bacteroidales bacterium]|nr:helix-turn-helix domain-containing protein [Bacteroidales bacterium]
VEYYAGRLDISPRYLGTITREIDGQSPKDIIDTYIVQEIKILLSFSDMTLQQIADQLRFPDQSYLGRYFKRLAGKSPLEYRKGGLSM